MNDSKLVDIETQLAYQDDIIQSLSDTIYQQQKDIDLLKKQVQILVKRLQEAMDNRADSGLSNEKPPHY